MNKLINGKKADVPAAKVVEGASIHFLMDDDMLERLVAEELADEHEKAIKADASLAEDARPDEAEVQNLQSSESLEASASEADSGEAAKTPALETPEPELPPQISRPDWSHPPDWSARTLRRDFEAALKLAGVKENSDAEMFQAVIAQTAHLLGYQYLFAFPAERFPFTCEAAACVRANKDLTGAANGDGSFEYFYVYRKSDEAPFEVATKEMLDFQFLEFADSYVTVLEQLHLGLEERTLRSIRQKEETISHQ